MSPPIALSNLLTYLHRVAFLPEAAGRILEAGGPERVSYEDMMRCLADVAGKRRPLIYPVPVLSPTLSSYWLGLVTAVPANVSRALIGGLKHDFSADDADLPVLHARPLLLPRELQRADAVGMAELGGLRGRGARRRGG